MWFAKPYYLKVQHEKNQYGAIALSEEDAVESGTAAVAATEAATRAVQSHQEYSPEEDEEEEEEVI